MRAGIIPVVDLNVRNKCLFFHSRFPEDVAAASPMEKKKIEIKKSVEVHFWFGISKPVYKNAGSYIGNWKPWQMETFGEHVPLFIPRTPLAKRTGFLERYRGEHG